MVGVPRGTVTDNESFGFRYSYRDFLWILVVAFFVIAVIIPPVRKTKSAAIQGAVFITLHWDRAANADVDLWVKAPRDTPVGYSHMTGKWCDLVRDDLGRYMDPASRNEEMTICRSPPAGEWIVDAMLYRYYLGTSAPIKVRVTARSLVGGRFVVIAKRSFTLTYDGQQVTAFRFTLDKSGKLVVGSVNQIPEKLYTLDAQ